MRLKDFTFACLLTAMAMSVELLAATTGEILVVLTILSSLPLYLIARENAVFATISYLCISFLLFMVNPHQCLFFAFTNGVLGLVLGVCDKQNIYSIASIIISGISLFAGIVAVSFVIGFKLNWWIFALFPFCLFYTGMYRFIASKIYIKWLIIKSKLR